MLKTTAMLNMTAMLLMIAMTLIISACTTADETAEGQERDEQGPAAVSFDAYLRRTTRSGANGPLTLDGTTSLKEKGFGVLGYSTGEAFYSQRSLPGYMYNDHVTYDALSTHWIYSPLKYWPNGEGEAQGVTGQVAHRVSFFGYAPWVLVDENTGLVKEGADDNFSEKKGIVGLTQNTKTGDPMVYYKASFDPTERVDLCWATPKLNQTKPEGTPDDEASLVNMQFRHALTALNFQIDSDLMHDTLGGTINLDETRVWVRSVSIQGISDKGMLNLNNSNTTPVWRQFDCCDCNLDVDAITVYDGRRDQYEGLVKDQNETSVGLNPNLVQSEPYTITDGKITAPTATGVTETAVNLFGDDAQGSKKTVPVYAIPTTTPFRVTIVYDVETYDPKLITNQLSDSQTPGSTIQNNITAIVHNSGTGVMIEAGKSYVLKLHLGLRTVECEAMVINHWEEGDNADVEDFEGVDATILGVSIINNYNTGTTIDGNVVLP